MNNAIIRWALKGIAFIVGFAEVPLSMPNWIFEASIVISLIACMALGYKIAWRQGHSGIFILPMLKGKFGMEGLKLTSYVVEMHILGICLAFFIGLICGLLWIVAQ